MADSTNDVHAENLLAEPFEFSDITFFVEEKPIYSNRVFLSIHSPYFKRMFFGPSPTFEREVKLAADKKYADVRILFKLLMLDPGEALVNDDNVERLLELAEEFQLKQVKAECEKFLLFYWKDKEKSGNALKLATKFGLHLAIKELLKSGSDNPSVWADENIEQILAFAQEYQLLNVVYHCEKFLLENYKSDAQKVVRALELSAKFNLEKALANLLFNEDPYHSVVCDNNVERLLQVCSTYSLAEQKDVCLRFISEKWAVKGDRVLRAVELAHELNLPDLAKKFIPLAACRPLAEIDAALPKLSTELYAAILHAHAVRIHANGAVKSRPVYESDPCEHGRYESHRFYGFEGAYLCPGSSSNHLLVLGEDPRCNRCEKKFICSEGVNARAGEVCTCLNSAPPGPDKVVDEMINRSRRD